ncbi:MAG: site-2 protease family protein, partial [Lachnospiraceae bacterium]|nr:site-2 protease family protein [Lachnospiraceae bacterium]
FLMIFVSVNLGLGVFNLIPIPPLDGSRILGLILPEKYYFGYMRYERYGLYVLMAIILIENLTNIDILPLNEFKTMIGTWMLKIAAFLVGVPT